ncbi:hypothetical protein HHL11_01970 [Ramlibacter sp. G-1-2-2]|uniref:Uncharacterized protein n=1 Tax=Ramlibacter agri TaxID=2728837 RepID=A0A848GWJ7_9BURK|nr:hypothetical protein [Ramlibacter agri]NML42497.1 hypothetical protein [Ramlibacter agri]
MLEALHGAAPEHRLQWQPPFLPSACGRVAAAFRFDDEPEGEWLQMEAQAAIGLGRIPSVQVRICIPIPQLQAQAGFGVANDASRLGLAAVHFDAPAPALVVQQVAVFAGFHDEAVQRETTLNMLAAVFATVRACLELARAAEGNKPDELESFATCVISRMIRWDVAMLVPDSPAFRHMLEAAARPDDEADRSLVDRWLRAGVARDPAEERDFQHPFFDLEQRCRWILRDAMPNPPSAAPQRQLQLLERALSDRPEPWNGMVIAVDDIRGAFALGLDLEIAQVTPSQAEQLRRHFPMLHPAGQPLPALPPQDYWLTKPSHPQLLPHGLQGLAIASPRTRAPLR